MSKYEMVKAAFEEKSDTEHAVKTSVLLRVSGFRDLRCAPCALGALHRRALRDDRALSDADREVQEESGLMLL